MSMDIAVVGLAVMGQNLILNMDDKGYKVAVFNRTLEKVDEFVERTQREGRGVVGTKSLGEMVSCLKTPRTVMLMVKAGKPVDNLLEELLQLLSPGDIVVDGGNSLYTETEERCKLLKKHGMHFVGCGVSGGEEGARFGPSMMPGGSEAAWPFLKPIFQAICARNSKGGVCCEWVGGGGSGHFVKMVHNGIEYGDMQLICEAYHVLREKGLDTTEIQTAFESWRSGPLDSYLIDITALILSKVGNDGVPVVEKIRDTAGQKGTGRWTVEASLQLGAPMTLVAEAVFARGLSAIKEERMAACKKLGNPCSDSISSTMELEDIESALYAAKIISYTQGFMLLKRASKLYDWSLNYGSIAGMWMGGCIIRSAFLGDIQAAFSNSPDIESLLFVDFFAEAMKKSERSFRRVVISAIAHGIPCPGLASALNFFDGYRTERLPANLLQAQRDLFGAHLFEYESNPGAYVHYDWTGQGGSITSTHYGH